MKKTALSLTVATLVFCASSAIGDVPSIINYQGFLTSTSQGNNPIQGQREIRFSIFDNETLGNLIWQEVHPYVDIERGVFNVLLGAVDEPLLETHFKDTIRWLQLEVRDIDSPAEPYEIVSSRVHLTTFSYAFRVATIDSASGGTIKGDVEIKDGKLGIGTDSPVEQLDVVGNVIVSGKAAIGPGHNNSGALSFVAGEHYEVSGSFSTVAGGTENIASGQYSNIAGGSGNVASGDYATISGGRFNEASNGNAMASGYRAKASHDGTFVWSDRTDEDFASTGENQFLIRASGGVGVGTNNPQAVLHVGGVPGADGIMFPDGSLQTTAASAPSIGGIAVITGSASDGALITPPAGYTVAQSKCIVSSRAFGPMGSSQEAYRHWCYVTEEGGGWRVYARSQNAHYGNSWSYDTVNYMVIGVK